MMSNKSHSCSLQSLKVATQHMFMRQRVPMNATDAQDSLPRHGTNTANARLDPTVGVLVVATEFS